MEHDGIELNEKDQMPSTSRSILDSLDHHDLPDNDGFGDGFDRMFLRNLFFMTESFHSFCFVLFKQNQQLVYLKVIFSLMHH